MPHRLALAALVALLACTPAAAASVAWRPYQLPPGAHDLPIIWTDTCGGALGCYAYGDTVEVNPAARGNPFTVLEQQPPVPLDELVYLHELGHWFDAHAMTSTARESFEALIGVARDWSAPPNAPAEQFAQAFALCALYPVAPRRWPTRPTWGIEVYTYAPNRRQHVAACTLIRAVSAPAP